MHRFLFFCACLVCSLLATTSTLSAQSPDTFVKEFYTWYFKQNNHGPVTEQTPGLSRYISNDVLTHLQSNHRNSSYFTQVNDWHPHWVSPTITALPAIAMMNDIFCVPVTFTLSSAEKRHVVVFVKHSAKTTKIIKVTDTYPAIRLIH